MDFLEDIRWAFRQRGFREEIIMGKKSRLKKRRYNLRQHEFLQFVCPQCGLCAEGTRANFCYEGHYLEAPKRFMKFVLPKLITLREELSLVGPAKSILQDDDDFAFTLEEAFCDSNICGNAGIASGINCTYKIGCLQSLREQARAGGKKITSIGLHRGRKRNKSKKNKRRKKYVAPTPTFFCNDSFREEVDKIIGNNTEQQNKGEESTRSSSAGAGGQAADSES